MEENYENTDCFRSNVPDKAVAGGVEYMARIAKKQGTGAESRKYHKPDTHNRVCLISGR